MGNTPRTPFHRAGTKKRNKRCLKCGKPYKGITSLSVKPVNCHKPQPGICPQCKHNPDSYTEIDLGGQDLNLEVEMK